MLNQHYERPQPRSLHSASQRHGLARGGALLALAVLLALPCGGLGAAPSRSAQNSSQQSSSARARSRQSSRRTERGKRGKKSDIPTTVVLLFQPDTKGGVSDQLGDVISDVEESRLRATGNYSVIYFQTALPSIRRALLDHTINPEDARPPFDNNAKATRLAHLLSYPMVLVSAIESYEYNAPKKTVSLVLSGRLMDVSGQTTRVIRAVTITGDNAKSGAAPDAKEETIASQVARDTAERLMNDLLQPPAKPAPEEKSKATGQTGASGK